MFCSKTEAYIARADDHVLSNPFIQREEITFSNCLRQDDGSTLAGESMCGATQSARKRAVKVNFKEITFLKPNQRLWTFFCALVFPMVYPLFDPGCLFVICVKTHIFLEAQCCCINCGFNWMIHKYTKLKISQMCNTSLQG